MSTNYKISTTKDFDKCFTKLAKKDSLLAKRVIQTLNKLCEDPFYQGLQTHKVQSKNYGIAFSSRVTGDIRIIWDFVGGNPIILVLTIGGHSGGRSVY